MHKKTLEKKANSYIKIGEWVATLSIYFPVIFFLLQDNIFSFKKAGIVLIVTILMFVIGQMIVYRGLSIFDKIENT